MPRPSPPSTACPADGSPSRLRCRVGWADGWLPGGSSARQLGAKLGELRRRWIDAGRPEPGPIVWPMQEVVDDDRLRAQLDPFEELSIDQVVLDIPTAGREEILPLLDRYAKVITAWAH